MTSTDITLPSAAAPAPRPDQVGQATAIEQSRAIAQVQAAVLIARQYPRNVQRAIAAMQEATARPSLANSAFYEYRRGGERVTGSTIKLAQELARIWGNVDFGLAELSLDTVAGQSEMLAYAWDLESNARFSQIVIVKHIRDKKVNGEKIAERVSDQRDIYELNTSNAARRLRESIRRVVPDWFFEEAEARCRATLENPGDGLTVPQRIAKVIRAFENGFGIDVKRLEERVGKAADNWTAWDVAQLTITGDSLHRGELRVEEEFPQRRVTAAEIAGATAPTAQAAPGATAEPTADAAAAAPQTEPGPAPEPAQAEPADAPAKAEASVTKAQLDKLHATLTELEVKERADKLSVTSMIAGRKLASSADLTMREASKVIETLTRCLGSAEPVRELDAVLASLDSQEARA
ncbi:hypothetical protein [Amycolatopsis sp. NPDC006125]|uniref:hypothetical protein n=1 Tax=Amycolatopsis sp. NPDC006125 TaxID=3156730 RepID=UPI0033A997B6